MFTNSAHVLNLHDFLFFPRTDNKIFLTVLLTIDFYCMDKKDKSQNINTLQSFFFNVPQNKEIHAGLKRHEDE